MAHRNHKALDVENYMLIALKILFTTDINLTAIN